MKKLFEIPVYAVSRKELSRKVKLLRLKIRNEHERCSREHMIAVEELATYSYRLWDYNHIVGYIRISTEGRDIFFDVFLPESKCERYRWKSKRKRFLYNTSANGTHFYVNDRMTNEDIQVSTAEMFQSVIKNLIPKRYFTDTEAFNNLNGQLNYIEIMEK